MRATRIAALEEMLQADEKDEFALYALALEYRQEDRLEEAEALLERLLKVQPDQLYGYFQLGDLLIEDGRPEEARPVLEAGVARAEALSDQKARNEIMGLLDQT